MVDVHDRKTRSKNMSAIKNRNTKPELMIRKMLHKNGFRYRLNVKELPGKPDLVFPRYNAVLMINGCFWHGHDCHLFKWPKTREEFWTKKISTNILNDSQKQKLLFELGWKIGIVWECALKGTKRIPEEEIARSLSKWLNSGEETIVIQGAAI